MAERDALGGAVLAVFHGQLGERCAFTEEGILYQSGGRALPPDTHCFLPYGCLREAKIAGGSALLLTERRRTVTRNYPIVLLVGETELPRLRTVLAYAQERMAAAPPAQAIPLPPHP